MNIEEEIFKRAHVDFNKLEEYGFKKEKDDYIFSKNFMNDDFKAVITVNKDGIVSGKIYDQQTEEEYTNIRIEIAGAFANSVREAYKDILKDIKEKCFTNYFFLSDQANRITQYIIEKYGNNPEFLWDKFPFYGVFRNNDKWYGVIMNIDKSKIDKGSGEIEIIDVKADEETIASLIKQKGFYEAYHMNKKSWLTIILDDTITDEKIIELIDNSYNLVSSKEYWIVPANPKYYDVTKCFDDTNIITWKQSTDIHIGDIVYLYLSIPYSAIFYKCEVIDVNIPHQNNYKEILIEKVMKLKLLKKYKPDEYTFKYLNELGIKSVRSPRRITQAIKNKPI